MTWPVDLSEDDERRLALRTLNLDPSNLDSLPPWGVDLSRRLASNDHKVLGEAIREYRRRMKC